MGADGKCKERRFCTYQEAESRNPTGTEGEEQNVHVMVCPLCDSPEWSSVEKNKDGVNLRVQCKNCSFIYRTQFLSESVDYRLADAYGHGHIMREVKIPNDGCVFRVWVSQDKVVA